MSFCDVFGRLDISVWASSVAISDYLLCFNYFSTVSGVHVAMTSCYGDKIMIEFFNSNNFKFLSFGFLHRAMHLFYFDVSVWHKIGSSSSS
jgi:hypothetical protein